MKLGFMDVVFNLVRIVVGNALQ